MDEHLNDALKRAADLVSAAREDLDRAIVDATATPTIMAELVRIMRAAGDEVEEVLTAAIVKAEAPVNIEHIAEVSTVAKSTLYRRIDRYGSTQ